MPFWLFLSPWRRRKPRYMVEMGLRNTLMTGILLLIGLLTAHIFAMMWFEGMSFGDALWLTMTTVTTVGYGDLSAKTDFGRTATIVLIYLCAIWVMAQTVSNIFTYRAERRELQRIGQWRWNMEKHILVINVPNSGAPKFLEQLAR